MTAYLDIEDALQVLAVTGSISVTLIDGNKRTGWTLTALTLWVNGYRHDFSTDDAFDLVHGVASGNIGFEDCAPTTSGHLLPRQNQESGAARLGH